MQLMHFGSAAMVAALAVALAPSAQAQDVPFGTLNSGPVAPMSLQAQNTVVRSQAELDSTGLSQLMPRAALVRIDWDKEMLIAVVMGPQRSGGHGISVEAINWRITPFGGGPGAPLGGARHLEVQVKKTYPAPGSIVTMAITNPFQLIKLDKTSAPIVFRDAPTAQRLSFKRVDYTESDQLSGSLAGSYETRTISLLDNGGVSVLRTHPVARYAPISGQANAQELNALSAAVRRARAASIPGQLQIPIVPFQHSFTLDIAGSQPALSGKISGMTDDYSGYDARLAPVVTLIEAIGKRVEDEFNRAQRELKGTLEVRGGVVYVVEQGQAVEITPASEAAGLRMFAGRAVRLEGQRSGSGSFALSKVLSPRSASVGGIAMIRGGRYVLDRSHLEIFPPLPAVALAGHLARLAGVARGKRLVVRGWLFDEDKQNPELIVTSVLANAKSARALWPQGRVNAGDAVEVTYAFYGWARIVADQGGSSGWMPMRNLSIGEPLAPLHGPAGSTTGAAGAVTGSGN